MKVEIKYPIPDQKPQYAQLFVNGIRLGQWIFGKEKKYENPEKWARDMIKKRTIVLDRNIARLTKELADMMEERRVIND